MKKIFLIILGLIAIIGLSYSCFFMKKDSIRETLLSKAQSTYKVNQMDWVHPKLQGENLEITRILQLNGNAPSQEAKDEAEKIAYGIEGISGVNNQITLPVAINNKTEDVNIEELVENITEEESEIASKENATPLVLSWVNPEEGETASNTNDTNDTIEKDEKKEIEKITTKTTTPSPYTFSAIKNENGNILLSGSVGSQEEYDNTILIVKKLFGENRLKNELKIASGNPKGWNEMVLLAINKLNDIDYGDINITDSSYVFNAHVSSDKEKQDFLNDIKAKLSTPNNQYVRYQGDYIITAPVPIDDQNKNGDQQTDNQQNIPIAKTQPIESKKGESNQKSNRSCQNKFNFLLEKEKIQFQYNKSTIKKGSYALLNDLAKVAKECQNIKIIIGGYTDSRGSRDYNKYLSKKRAQRVKRYLIKKGISSRDLKAIGYGESRPIADNFNEAGRAKNRRIEFKIEGMKK